MKSPQTEDGFTKIANELQDAFCKVDLSGSSWRCLSVIIRKTYGYHKKKDSISLTQFEQLTGMTRMGVAKGLNELEKNKMIFRCRAKYITSYEVNKNYEEWGSIQNDTSIQLYTKTSIQNDTKTSIQLYTHKRKERKKEISETKVSQLLALKEKDMGWKPYNENTHSDDIPSIGDDGEIVKTEEALKKEQNEKVTALIEWAEKVRKKKFIDITTQRKMIHDMRKAKISPDVIKATYLELLHSEYWTTGNGKDRLPDFKTVFSSLKNKK